MLTPFNDGKSIHFDVLFKMQSKDWPDEVFKLLPKQERFTDVMNIVFEQSGKLVKWEKQIYGHSYHRFNKVSKKKELLSYAGGNSSMHTNNT